jgi:preprotein translocase subunit SecE
MKDSLEKVRRSLTNIRDFLRETRKELNNVSWPNRREVTGTTLVVIASVFFFGFFLFVVDFLVSNGMDYLRSVLRARF